MLALLFNKGYAQIPAGRYYYPEFTYMIWVKTLSYNNWQRILDFGDGFRINNLIIAQFAATGRGYLHANGVEKNILNVSYPLNEWVHVAFTSDTKSRLYINCVQIIELNSNMTVQNTTLNYIGKSQTSVDEKLNAVVDDFKIFNKALSVEEILKEKGDFKEKEKTVANSLVNHWPMDNSEKDIVGGKDMVIKENGKYTTDRFGNENSGNSKSFLFLKGSNRSIILFT